MAKEKNIIYMPVPLEGYELCHPVDQQHFETITELINGVPRKNTWRPIEMEIIHEDENEKLSESDSPWLGEDALMFRQRALKVLAPLLEQYGELLPLKCKEAEVVMFNPTNILDALDEAASSIIRFSSGRIMDVERYAFRPEVIGDNQIFKIPNLRSSPTYVGREFVKLWKDAGLRGLGFKKIWAP